MDSPAIEVSGLRKRFGRYEALRGLDLVVKTGQVHGFLGPNGAGKSTTIRTLLGLNRPDAGSVRVLGEDPAHRSVWINRQVSYVPGDVVLWPNLTGGQALDVLAGLRGKRDPERERVLIDRFELDVTKRSRTYSKGNRQKVALVAAFAAPTPLLVLDEPTSGLDPLMEEAFAYSVTEAAEEGRTVLLSSHILAEVQRLCTYVTIIRSGSVVEQGDLHSMQALVATRVSASGDEEALKSLEERMVAAGARPERSGQRLLAQVERSRVPQVLGMVSELGLTDVTCEPASLEDLFLRHYGE